ncbi:hypothetical protein [Caloranaerobacter sp. DY30410]
MKRLLIILIIILILTVGSGVSIGYCDGLDDPEPWYVEPGTLQN